LECTFDLKDDGVSLVDYVADPLEVNGIESWHGVKGLLSQDEKFGVGTADFLRNTSERHFVHEDGDFETLRLGYLDTTGPWGRFIWMAQFNRIQSEVLKSIQWLQLSQEL